MTKEELLDKELEREFDSLAKLQQGSKEHANAVEAICKLVEAREKAEKTEVERDEHVDEEFHRVQERKDRRFRMLIDGLVALGSIGTTVAGLVCYNHWWKGTLRYEETGSVSSIAGKNVVNGMSKLLPKN